MLSKTKSKGSFGSRLQRALSSTFGDQSEEDADGFVPEYDFGFDIAVLGVAGVGKSSLLAKECGFAPPATRSLGIHFMERTYDTLGSVVRVRFLDVDGGALDLGCNVCRDAAAIILCYDVTNRSTFDAIPNILSAVKSTSVPTSHQPLFTLVGTKNEDPSLRAVYLDEAAEFAEDNDLELYETSAVLDGSETADAFAQIVTGVCKLVEVQDEDGGVTMNLDPVVLYERNMHLHRPLTATERIRMRGAKRARVAETQDETEECDWL
ncbi:P-loop containing nucleoside triphosphate hydrolase protein [Gonapodya prolifera JEL478]|uniref:p-loop containing nucleoside triphosphate hydrolase protein n=1 Tax=Gonapodya prolifera (strain JEL478) TaxID=1344416 RepID=A0A139AUA2_GONPJ|nr:P-loop containing nucleoside triphosphate hydrolase protein [Gonapodya prolifera JEL478]|eukprot:KXS20298.1 P-loop containing nucleoside triphosphate hydrolase protein [Gonapodya prolifera JEL478]